MLTYSFHIVESEESESAAEDPFPSGQSVCMLLCRQNTAMSLLIVYVY